MEFLVRLLWDYELPLLILTAGVMATFGFVQTNGCRLAVMPKGWQVPLLFLTPVRGWRPVYRHLSNKCIGSSGNIILRTLRANGALFNYGVQSRETCETVNALHNGDTVTMSVPPNSYNVTMDQRRKLEMPQAPVRMHGLWMDKGTSPEPSGEKKMQTFEWRRTAGQRAAEPPWFPQGWEYRPVATNIIQSTQSIWRVML